MKRMVSAARATQRDTLEYYVDILNDVAGHEKGSVGSYTVYGGRGAVYLAVIINSDGGLKNISGFMNEKNLTNLVSACISVLEREK